MAAKIKKGDKVVVLAGRAKGRTGEVVKVMPDENRALVRGVNMVRRHQRQTASQEGGIILPYSAGLRPLQAAARAQSAESRGWSWPGAR